LPRIQRTPQIRDRLVLGKPCPELRLDQQPFAVVRAPCNESRARTPIISYLRFEAQGLCAVEAKRPGYALAVLKFSC
jgi:hypothetical protein